MHVEYSTRPSEYELVRLPNGKIIAFLRENITSDIREMDDTITTVWTADEYSLTLSPRLGLEQDIANNTAAYLAQAKAEDTRLTNEKAAQEYERELMKNMPEMLLKLNYQMMMLESSDTGEI